MSGAGSGGDLRGHRSLRRVSSAEREKGPWRPIERGQKALRTGRTYRGKEGFGFGEGRVSLRRRGYPWNVAEQDSRTPKIVADLQGLKIPADSVGRRIDGRGGQSWNDKRRCLHQERHQEETADKRSTPGPSPPILPFEHQHRYSRLLYILPCT
jgi:hypothetical protein